MDWPRLLIPNRCFAVAAVTLATTLLDCSAVTAQVRTKRPDRGVYQSPQLTEVEVESLTPPPAAAPHPKQKSPQVAQASALQPLPADEPLELAPPQASDASNVAPASHQTTMPLVDPDGAAGQVIWDQAQWPDHSPVLHDGTCDGCADCGPSCDSIGGGCDSIGGCGLNDCNRCFNAGICFSPDRWFGGVELLMMFRNGDRLPTLVTTGPSTNAATAGELGQTGTRILVGDQKVFDDFSVGGRVTLGTWLDSQHCRSLVMRGWAAEDDGFSFSASQADRPVIVRPFFNVTDGQTAAQDTQLVAFPNRANGSISVNASNDVFGGDVSIRQLWYSRFGGSVDLLYGYQYMRMNEDLRIASSSTSLDDNFAPLGSVLAITDTFDAENEFHGGQVGVTSRYREGCWSFHSLLKLGFGSLRRSAELQGSTFTSVDGANATDPNGLLVRSTNSGTTSDTTFGFVPELDLTIGWQRYRNFDVTAGYHIIAMTDALRVADTVDPNLAVNLADAPTGQQRPTVALRYDTFYVQGIHFGLRYVY